MAYREGDGEQVTEKEKILHGDFIAKQESVSEAKEEVKLSPCQEFLGRLFTWVDATVKEYGDFPLRDLLNSLNTVSLAYLVSTDKAEEQRNFLEWTYKASLAEVDRIEALKGMNKLNEEKVLPTLD